MSTLRHLPFRPVAASSNKQYSPKAWPQLHSSLSGKVIGKRGEEVWAQKRLKIRAIWVDPRVTRKAIQQVGITWRRSKEKISSRQGRKCLFWLLTRTMPRGRYHSNANQCRQEAFLSLPAAFMLSCISPIWNDELMGFRFGEESFPRVADWGISGWRPEP